MEPASTNPDRNSFSSAAIAAAAIAAVTISSGVHKRNRLIPGNHRRRNRPRPICETVCENPGCHCRPVPLGSGRSRAGSFKVLSRRSSSESCSESKPCVYCLETLETLAEEHKFEKYENGHHGQKVTGVEECPCPICLPPRQYSEAQLPDEQCPVHNQRTVGCALHKSCCEHQPNSSQITAPWTIAGSYYPDLPSSEYSHTTGWPIETCCVQRVRHASPVSSDTLCRKKQIHPEEVTCYDSKARGSTSQTHKVKALNVAKSRSKEKKVEARRIRHPLEDSNSESELGAPVVDVRALRPTSSSSSSSPLPSGRRRTIPLCPSKALQPESSSPIAADPVQHFQCIQTNPCTASPEANSNKSKSPVPVPKTKHLPSTSSSDSSSTTDCPGTISSTSTSSYSCTNLSDSSSTSSNDGSPYANPYAASYYQYRTTALGNPFHTYYHEPQGPSSSGARSSTLPISSGDFWNVRRAWQRNRTSAEGGRHPEGPSYGSRIARETPIYHGVERTWTPQPTTSPSTMYYPRNI